MALVKVERIESIEVNQYGDLNIKTVAEILEDGVVLSKTIHRRVIYSDQVVDSEIKKIKDLHAIGKLHAVARPEPSVK